MIVRQILVQLFSTLWFLSFGQKADLEKVGILPNALSECSGICYLPSGNLAMINDSGNEPEVFICTTDGKLVKRQYLQNVCNTDWEEIQYYQGHIYIGDFGNNDNEREKLAILKYKIDEKDSLYDLSNIIFEYSEQKQFPPHRKFRHFDLEAMVVKEDTISLFTKNRSRPFDGYTYLYQLPNVAGHYSLTRQDSFRTGLGDKSSFWVAGAALSPSGNQLVLLGYDKMWLFRNFTSNHFFKGESTTLAFPSLTQKESVTFTDEYSLMITDEKNTFGGGIIYKTSLEPESIAEFTLKNKVVEDSLIITWDSELIGSYQIEIFTTSGQRVFASQLKPTEGKLYFIDTKTLSPGGYVLNILLNGKSLQAIKFKKPLPKNYK